MFELTPEEKFEQAWIFSPKEEGTCRGILARCSPCFSQCKKCFRLDYNKANSPTPKRSGAGVDGGEGCFVS